MMTPIGKTFTWMLWPANGRHSGASDEFIADGFRVRLSGSRLEVTCAAMVGCSPDSAKALAERYIQAVGHHVHETLTIMSEAEWLERTTPPFQNNETIGNSRLTRIDAAIAVGEARNELLDSADPTLRRCYDHLQKAKAHMHEEDDQTAVSIYKAMEELETCFGGKEKAEAQLGRQFKDVKRAANDSRHTKGKFEPMSSPPASLVGSAEEVIRKYESWLLATSCSG